MLKPRKKLTKRELKQDKFVLATLKTKDFLEKNSKFVTRSILALVILIVVVTLFIRSKETANLEAAAMLGQTQLLLSQGQRSSAIDSLKLLIEMYDGTRSSGKAAYILGKLYWEDNEFENAKKYLQKFIDSYLDKTVISQSGLALYADCLLNEGNIYEAAKYYEKAAKINKDLPETPALLFSAAESYREAGDFNRAKNLANEIINKHQKSPIKSRAEVLLESIDYEKS
jgi:tetratricopeptide (TPR) repeat protein